MNFKQIMPLLIGFFLCIIVIGCNTGTIRDYSLDTYESTDYWELSNESTNLSINNYNVFAGGHSIQIINDDCGDLSTKNSFNLNTVSGLETGTVAGQEYKISVTVKRSATDYDINTPVDPRDDEDSILRGDNFSIIIKQNNNVLLDEEAEIELDLTWETKTFTFVTKGAEDVKLTFRLGCDLELFWIDNLNFSFIEPEPVEVDP